METTQDRLLSGGLTLFQPKHGYRAAIDPILLSAALHPAPRDHILDVGCGVGAAFLCLAHHAPNCHFTGVEMQGNLAALAQKNIDANGRTNRARVIHSDISQKNSELTPHFFDHVISNPPFYEATASTLSPHETKLFSHAFSTIDLAGWMRFCLKMLKPKGSLTLIHRSEAMPVLLSLLTPQLGNLRVYPLWPKTGARAKRVLIQGEKSSKAPFSLRDGLTLHTDTGGYTPHAAAVLAGKEKIYL